MAGVNHMKKFILLLFLCLVFSQDSRTAYSVSGQVFLENSDDYSGVQISFYDLLQDPPVLFDFMTSFKFSRSNDDFETNVLFFDNPKQSRMSLCT